MKATPDSVTTVLLRDLRPTDAPRLAFLANNHSLWRQLRDGLPHPYTEADAEWFIGEVGQNRMGVVRGIIADGELAGVVGLIPQGDVHRLSAEIGYWLGEPYWGGGVMTRAVGEMVRYGFETMNLVRIYAGIFSSNPASMRVLEKNGFLLEGIGRMAVVKEGRLLDEYRYALTCHTGNHPPYEP
ncbi:GNAT family N-acetyltransferase [Larkinella soli]|uniref:GNAT family N-acetyltransferase n=1 Tax=Larkinella soli TaxID=1770527 RepID=UPI000FFBC713|nr:GNAT family protein [Larkinella soli]